jgi:hypothetical protein
MPRARSAGNSKTIQISGNRRTLLVQEIGLVVGSIQGLELKPGVNGFGLIDCVKQLGESIRGGGLGWRLGNVKFLFEKYCKKNIPLFSEPE